MIFDEQVARKPDLYPWTRDFIDAMWQGHWTPNEFSFKSDLHDFKVNLTEQERGIIVRTLSAISQIEVAVKKFWSRLGDNLPHPSITDMGLVMAQIEVVHNKAYEKLLDVLDLYAQFEENLKATEIGNRVIYLRKYLDKNYQDDKKQYLYSLILFTLFVENISLFSQFYIILWFNRYKNILRDTAQQVQYTKNEELLHAQAGIKLINTITIEYPEIFDAELQVKIIQESTHALISEFEIIDWILGDFSASHLNADIVKTFILNRMNESLRDIGIISRYEIDSQLISQTLWMDEEVFGNSMTDFFWKRPVEYTKKATTFSEEDLF